MALPDPAEHSLVGYNPDDYPRVAVTVDIVVFTIVDNDLRVLLGTRPSNARRDRGVLGDRSRPALPHRGKRCHACRARIGIRSGERPTAAGL